MRITCFISCLFLWVNNSFECAAQSSYRAALMPGVNINKNLILGWEINGKLEFRLFNQTKEVLSGSASYSDFSRMDNTIMIAKKVGLASKFISGYLFRITPNQNIHRTIEQFAWVQKPGNYRLSHRLASDQTYYSESDIIWRFRYRIGTEIPLNGETLNSKEFYMKLNNEYLYILERGSTDFEIRLIPVLGYSLTDSNKIEMGLDYRVDQLFSDNLRHNFWPLVKWYSRI